MRTTLKQNVVIGWVRDYFNILERISLGGILNASLHICLPYIKLKGNKDNSTNFSY
jgi:hypothetical protein